MIWSLDNKCFVFGTNDPLQLIHNYNMVNQKFSSIDWNIRLRRDGFFVVYENGKYIQTLRKPFRKAKRIIKLIDDIPQDVYTETSCRICTVNRMCIMNEPCGHLGMCNNCSYMANNMAFYKRIGFKRIHPDPRFSHADNLEAILNDINKSKCMCPFCNNEITGIKYVYIC